MVQVSQPKAGIVAVVDVDGIRRQFSHVLVGPDNLGRILGVKVDLPDNVVQYVVSKQQAHRWTSVMLVLMKAKLLTNLGKIW